MSISRQNLSVVIVSFFSEEVIHNCIQSIPEDVNILVVDNSGNKIEDQDHFQYGAYGHSNEAKIPDVADVQNLFQGAHAQSGPSF